MVVVFAAATAWVLVWPASGMPARVDAIVMMAGPGARIPVATLLADEHRAPVLVVSQGQHGYGGPCPPPVAGVTTICFDPVPGDTRGEAEFAGHLARLYGWHSIVLVTSSEQATRAQIMMGRCFPGAVYVMTAPVPVSQVPYQIAYGWAALFKALVLDRNCLPRKSHLPAELDVVDARSPRGCVVAVPHTPAMIVCGKRTNSQCRLPSVSRVPRRHQWHLGVSPICPVHRT